MPEVIKNRSQSRWRTSKSAPNALHNWSDGGVGVEFLLTASKPWFRFSHCHLAPQHIRISEAIHMDLRVRCRLLSFWPHICTARRKLKRWQIAAENPAEAAFCQPFCLPFYSSCQRVRAGKYATYNKWPTRWLCGQKNTAYHRAALWDFNNVQIFLRCCIHFFQRFFSLAL